MSYFQQIARRVSSEETARSQPIPRLNPPKPLFPPVADFQLREFVEEPFGAEAAGITAEVSRSSHNRAVPALPVLPEEPLTSSERSRSARGTTSHFRAPAPPKRSKLPPESSPTIAPIPEFARDSGDRKAIEERHRASPPPIVPAASQPAPPTRSPKKPTLESDVPADREQTGTEWQAALATPELISKSLESSASNASTTAESLTPANTKALPTAAESSSRVAKKGETLTPASAKPLPIPLEPPASQAAKPAEPLPITLKPQPSAPHLPEKRGEILAPSPSKPDVPESPTVRIGAIDIQIIPPVAPEARRMRSLARGFTSGFGLRQG